MVASDGRGEKVRLGLVQMACTDDQSRNVAHAAAQIERAALRGAQLVCLPELFNVPYFCHSEDLAKLSYAQPIPGPATDAISAVAAKFGIVVVAPTYELAPSGERFNSAAIIGPDGTLIDVYRKSSIPLSIMADWTSVEQFYFSAGDTGFRVVETPFGISLGVLICYDRHFPEAARVLALRGADLILVPTATGGPSRDSWEIELRAHAIANICYVAGVNRVGWDNGDTSRPRYYGASFVCGCRGEVLASAGETDDELVFADIDTVVMSTARNQLGWFRDRRPDLYGDITASHMQRPQLLSSMQYFGNKRSLA
jgi:N-carbamoylputrescine amidase